MDNDSKNFEKEKTMKNGEERNIGDNKPKAESSGNYFNIKVFQTNSSKKLQIIPKNLKT